MTTLYIPDYIRSKRTDHLWHYRESLQTIVKRYLPTLWVNRQSHDRVSRLHEEILLINEELWRREHRIPAFLRESRRAQYIANRS